MILTLSFLGVSEFLNETNLGEKLLMPIASNKCNFKMGKNERRRTFGQRHRIKYDVRRFRWLKLEKGSGISLTVEGK